MRSFLLRFALGAGIRNFIVGVVVEISSDETALRRQKMYINKLNITLVQILKQDWPANWPQFIPEVHSFPLINLRRRGNGRTDPSRPSLPRLQIVASSKTSLPLCENNMVILKLLSEEIFDYSAEQMTQAKTKALKDQMCGEFSEIFELCSEVLGKAQKPSLIKATLETLLRFLNWIPLGYIFETNIIDNLVSRVRTSRLLPSLERSH